MIERIKDNAVLCYRIGAEGSFCFIFFETFWQHIYYCAPKSYNEGLFER